MKWSWFTLKRKVQPWYLLEVLRNTVINLKMVGHQAYAGAPAAGVVIQSGGICH